MVTSLGGSKKAVVARARNCTVCRECIREPGWEEKIELNRIRDHFMFSIESTGVYSPPDLFRECVKVLSNKCQIFLDNLESA